MVNLYILITLIAAICLTIVFAGLLGWEVSQQNKVYAELKYTEWKHKNFIIDYIKDIEDTSTQSIQLTCPVDKHMFITNAMFQLYDPLLEDETSWEGHYDSYWTSYGAVNSYSEIPGDAGYQGKVGQCGFNQTIAGHLNQTCLNATGNCTVKVNKNGVVNWDGGGVAGENAVCSTESYCHEAEAGCQLALGISYVCTSEEEVANLTQFSIDSETGDTS